MLMSILGSDTGETAESPEKNVEKMESEVISELKDLQENMEEMFEAESRLVEGLEDDLPEDRIEQRISSIEIHIQEDIAPEEKDLESKVREMEKREARLKKKGNLTDQHRKLLETIEDAISKVRHERKRLRNVVEEADSLISGEDFSQDKVLQELADELETEGEEARALEEEIAALEGEERKIQS